MWPFASKEDVRKEIQSSQQALVTELRQYLQPPTPTAAPQDTLMHMKLDRLYQQIEELAKIVNQTMPTTPDGSLKPVHERIEVYLQSATAALDQLKQEHATWLQEQQQRLQAMQPTLEALQKQHAESVHHIFPSKEHPAQDTGPITQV
jgi:hypothetical protein